MDKVLHYIRAIAPAPASAGVPDRELLARFARDRDEAAFAALVGRYGASVWAACRRLVDREQDAEDAFQATFLTLARKAGSIRGGDALAAWLHGVARRVAANIRRDARRRTDTEAHAATLARRAETDLTWQEGLAVLDEELARLPQKYRAVLIACCLDGRPRDEAAAQLGWSEGQVKGRLERAREMLRRRLQRRGFSCAALLLAAAVSDPAPTSLVSATVNAAVSFVSGLGLSGDVSPVVVVLAKGVMKAMFLRKMPALTAVLLALTIIGGGLLTYRQAQGTAPARVKAALAFAPTPGPKDATLVKPMWGKPANGLRLGLCQAETKADGKVRLLVTLENVSADDLIVNLGLMLGNGKKQVPTAVRLLFTDVGGKTRTHQRKVGGIAGRVDPFGVPLAAGCRYVLACDPEAYVDAARPGVPLAPGAYRVTAEFVGEKPDKDTTGLALMTYWTGTIQSGECPLTLPAKQEPVRGEK